MKIGLFLPNATFDLPGSPEVGGIEVYAMDLGEALMSLGHEVVLFGGTPRPGRTHRPVKMRLRLAPYWETRQIPKLGTRFRKLVQRLHFAVRSRRALREEKCDVVFVFKPYDFINARFWKKTRPDLRVVMNYQGKDFFPTDAFWRTAIDWEYACSEDNAALVENRFGVRPEVIPNGVETGFYSPPATPPPPRHVVSAGRLVGWKGLPIMAQALCELPGWTWTVAGDGPDRESLDVFAREHQLTDRIRFAGTLGPAGLRALFHSASLMVQPSLDFDACPTAVLQGLSCGVPAVLSDRVGLAQPVQNAGAGIVFPAGNAAALARALRAMDALPEEGRTGMRHQARVLVENEFSITATAQRISATLKGLAGVA
ncbi:MAG: glycosyltransferase family 4 protein [Verrucomicrobiae bacterium]|nr:glycosyltransferase family 4 protein [Verrucomicrobiae bacterium]